MTAWKAVQKTAKMGVSNHGESSGQWFCNLLFPFLWFTSSLQLEVLCGSSICPLQGQVLPSVLCLSGNQNDRK